MTSGQLDGQPVAINNGQLVIGSGANAHRYVPPPDLGPSTERFVGLWEPVLADGRPALPHNARLALRPDGTFAASDFCQTIRGDWLVDQRSRFSSGGAKGAYETCPPGATSLPVAARDVVARATANSMVLGDQRFLRVPMPVVPEQGWLPGYDHLTADTAVTDEAILARVIAGMKRDPSNGYTNQPVYAWHLADAEGQGGQQAHYYLAGFDGHSCIATLYEPNADGGGYSDGTGCTAIDPAPDLAAPTGVDDVFIVPDAVESVRAENTTGASEVVEAKDNAVILPRGYVPAMITYTQADGSLTHGQRRRLTAAPLHRRRRSAAGELDRVALRAEAVGDLLAVVALDLDGVALDGSARAAQLLQVAGRRPSAGRARDRG